MPARVLTNTQRDAIRAEVVASLGPDRRVPKGLTERMAKRYGVANSAIQWHARQAVKGFVRPKMTTVQPPAVDADGRNQRVLKFLGRMVARRPSLFTELKIMEAITQKYPDLMADCL